MIIPKWAGNIPIIGKTIKSASKENNKKDMEYDKRYKRSHIAT